MKFILEKIKSKNRILLTFLISISFFVAGVFTLSHYGINWDTINHLPRGQTYLRYLLTGKKDYSDLPRYFSGWQKSGEWYWQNPDSLGIKTDLLKEKIPKRSMYQIDSTPADYFLNNDGGHPPLSDILSSVFNRVLFGKLRLINDIDSYRVYGVFLAAALVGLVFWWVTSIYGNFAGLIASLSLAVYPLFWSESHFNTEKDIPETVFWSFMLFSIWKGVTNRSWKWILISGTFFGLALGTKFNILFSVFVIVPWLLVFLLSNYFKERIKPGIFLKRNIWLVWTGLLAVFIGMVIFVGTWPYLWLDIITRLGSVISFYKDIGLTQSIDSRFIGPFKINTYPIQWIAYSTPLITLFLFLIGTFAAILRVGKKKDRISFFFLLWFAVPVARVIWPGTTIYGGVRQIMEFIPAMAILAGLGGMVLKDFLVFLLSRWSFLKLANKNFIAGALVLTGFVPIVVKLVQIHPNENVYFNPLIGGLSGARERDFPYWGNSFGAAYRQGVKWLNQNAELGARVAYARELIPNIPRIWLRQDLNLHNSNRSGYWRRGEYIIALTYQGTDKTSYFDRYLEWFLEPVYKIEVDGVPILKVWKNDKEHTKKEYLNEKQIFDFNVLTTDLGLRFDFGREVKLLSINAGYFDNDCPPLESAYVQISHDGSVWERLSGTMPKEDWSVPMFGNQPGDGKLFIPFAADEARYVDLVVKPKDACISKLKNIQVFTQPLL